MDIKVDELKQYAVASIRVNLDLPQEKIAYQLHLSHTQSL